jgi:hypothetical protein
MTSDAILPFPHTRATRTARARPPATGERAGSELALHGSDACSRQPTLPPGRAEVIPADDWQRRFMAHIHAVCGCSVNAATAWPEGYRGLSKGFEADPEGAASARLGAWLD